MIVRETPETFILITQHDHATISGKLAEGWKELFFWENTHFQDVLLAIYQHDRGWISLDKAPIWDQQNNKIYSFIGYPLQEKLHQYKVGIDEVEAMNSYAAILCSMHYCSFMNAENKLEKDFMEEEQTRQIKLKKHLSLKGPEKEIVLRYHFHLLQLFDDISLYLCINNPGISKNEEFPFFRNGFKNTAQFAFTGGKKIEAFWKDAYTVQVAPFPLQKECEVSVPYKEINKKDIGQYGLKKVYLNAPFQKYDVKIIE